MDLNGLWYQRHLFDRGIGIARQAMLGQPIRGAISGRLGRPDQKAAAIYQPGSVNAISFSEDS
jgi:hypothetical protein